MSRKHPSIQDLQIKADNIASETKKRGGFNNNHPFGAVVDNLRYQHSFVPCVRLECALHNATAEDIHRQAALDGKVIPS